MVEKEEFYLRLNAKYDQTTIKKPWNLEKTKEVTDILKQYQVKKDLNNCQELLSTSEKYYIGKYDLLEIAGKSQVIMKTKSVGVDVNIICITPIEEFFDKIDEAHKATGHGGRDKMLRNLKRKFNIPRVAVEIYIELCKICNLKKTRKHGGFEKPMIFKDFNIRGQFELVDFESCADGKYKWLLNYQDQSSKFLYLRPLETKRSVEVARELLKIFLEQGAPFVLQSDNGREFTAEVINELVALWPQCKIVQEQILNQRSIEGSDHDVEQMLRNWMIENKTSSWSVGCYFVQWQQNTSHNRSIGISPYKSLYGSDPKVNSSFTILPPDITVEDVESINKYVGDDDDDDVGNVENDDTQHDIDQEIPSSGDSHGHPLKKSTILSWNPPSCSPPPKSDLLQETREERFLHKFLKKHDSQGGEGESSGREESANSSMHPSATAKRTQNTKKRKLASSSSDDPNQENQIGDEFEDEFDEFGKHIASELRQFPFYNALQCQEKIERVINEERLLVHSRQERQEEIESVLVKQEPGLGEEFCDENTQTRINKESPQFSSYFIKTENISDTESITDEMQ